MRWVNAGELTADGVFVKRLKPGHILRTPPAIAIQADALDMLEKRGCIRIRAEVIGGDTLLASFADFRDHALYLDRGYGAQYALPLARWQKEGNAQFSLFEEVAG
ncbi:MAG: hypothetical protein ACYC7E_07295 [Armatimonadota bacterium]